MTTDPIKKFILKDKDNIRIAAAIGEAWPEVREQIAIDFQSRLEIRLKKNLKGWQFQKAESAYVTDYSGFYFWNTAWADQYWLGLQWELRGERMVLGVVRDKENIKRRPFCEKLFNAVKEIQPNARTNSWWEAKALMHSPASNWRKPEVLWRMRNDTFLEEVAAQLLELAKISDPIIRGLVRKYKK